MKITKIKLFNYKQFKEFKLDLNDEVNIKMWKLIDELVALGTKYYFVENPQGRMRHMDFVKDRKRYEVTYCS